MEQKAYGRDRGLSIRLFLTMFTLGLIYVAFFVVLVNILSVGIGFVILILGGIMFLQYFTSDKVALMASGAKVVGEEEAPELHAMVERLAQQAGLPKPRIAIAPTEVPNAFATGRNKKHAVVAVTQGLWSRLDKDEIEGVLAHELTHVKNRDVAVMTIASFFSMVAATLARFGLWGGMFSGGDRDRNSGAPVWLIMFAISIATYAISFILIQMISRYREYAADRGSAFITGAPEHLMSALQKISSRMTQIPQQDLREVAGMNAFFIFPAGLKKAGGELFMTHPPLEKRLAALAEIAREMGRPVENYLLGLFGRKKLPKADRQKLLSLTDAEGTLGELGLSPAGVAALVFKPPSAAESVRAETELQGLLDSVAQTSLSSRVDRRGDEFGFEWLIVKDGDLRQLLETVNLVASELVARNFGKQLLAAAFRFDGGEHPVYLIYGFQRGAFWPFVPTGEEKERDNDRELELKDALEKTLPMERDLTRWLALFDAPI